MAAITLTAYFDESGHPRDPRVASFTIGGWVARCDEWLDFDRAWMKALRDFKVPWFHMVDFEAAKHPPRRSEKRPNPYRSWNTARRHRFLNRLLDIIDHHKMSAIGTGEHLRPLRDRESVDFYYTYHYRLCLAHTARFAQDSTSNFVFARQELTDTPRKEKEFTDYYKLVAQAYPGKIGSVAVGDSRRVPALQAADLIAYEAGRRYERPQCMRYPFGRLKNKLYHVDLTRV